MSARYNPFQDVERFFEQMTQQFDAVSGRLDSDERADRWSSLFEAIPVDVVERDEQFVVTADLPGFEHDDIEVTVTERRLHIAAEHEDRTQEESGRQIRQERHRRSVERSISLPAVVDTEAVTAQLGHGVLTISIPKQSAETAQRIEIETE